MASFADNARNIQSGTQRIAQEVSNASRLEFNTRPPELLSFSSQLVYGSVGHNSSGVIYREYGIATAQIPTILLSVLPHYPSVHSVDIPAEWIAASVQDLDAVAALDQLRFMTTGYLADISQSVVLAEVFKTIQRLSTVPLIVDPTLGDLEVGFYTDPRLVEGIRQHLLPLATGMVPNLFELAQLSSHTPEELNTVDNIAAAARSLMSELTEWVVVTGLHLQGENKLSVLLVTADGCQIFIHEHIEHEAKGVGDAYTALLISELITGKKIEDAIPLANTAIVQRLQNNCL